MLLSGNWLLVVISMTHAAREWRNNFHDFLYIIRRSKTAALHRQI